MEQETLAMFIQLFRGRGDVYGSEEGGCVRKRLTPDVFSSHLTGGEPIGVYPMVPIKDEWMCAWGCTDIDVEDFAGAVSIRESLAAAGVIAHIEKSRSKGYHVWVFASKPVTAKNMRRMFLAAHQVADYPAREVNPKQEALTSIQVGNYVRLPYPNYTDLSTNKRRMINDDGTPIPMISFLQSALNSLTSPETVERIASLYSPPTVKIIVGDYQECESLQEAMNNLSPLGKVIWRDGPLPARDRSYTLARLGYCCVESGLNPSETKIILTDADRRWGKYHMRSNGESEIDKLVQRVFTNYKPR